MSTDDLLEMGMNELTNDFSEITKNESQSFCIQEPQTWFWWQNIGLSSFYSISFMTRFLTCVNFIHLSINCNKYFWNKF